LNAIPSDVRHHQIRFKLPHATTQQSETVGVSKLFGHFKQHLHTHTDSEQRRAFRGAFVDQRIKTAFTQGIHTRRERADTRQYQSLRTSQDLVITAYNSLATHRRKRLLDGTKI